jgi:gliding motility-associated-like protein
MEGTSVPVAKLTLLDPFTVTDSLSLDNPLGGKVFIGDNNFFVSSSAISTGGQDSCYIVTNGLGDLVKRGIGKQSFRFNVGTVSSFAPLSFADNNNTPDNFRVKVKPKANSTDFNPALPAQAAAFVKFQWEICEDQAGGSNAQLIFDWRDNIENVFGVASILNVVGRSTGTEWVPRVIPQIVTSSTGLSNVTEFCAPFAVYYDSLFNTVVIDTVLNLSNGAAVNAFCTGDSIEIRYRVFRQLVFGNTFTAFLYNSNGDSILIGSKVDNQSGSMFLTIPTTATVDNCSKIRIFSSTPALIGEFNRPCLRIRRTPIAPVVNVSGTFDFCQGETRTLSVSGGVSYLWTPTNETNESITVSVAGQYSVLLTDTSGCSVSSDTVALVEKPKPVKPQFQIVSGTNPFCEGASVTLGIVDSLANTIYTWQPGGPVITVAGTYFLIADSTNGCRDSSIAFVATTVTAPDTFSIQVTPEPEVCEGTSITLTAPAGFTYEWAGIPGLPITTQTATVSEVGAYAATVTITNTSGCSRTSNVANIAVRKAPTKPRIDTTLGTRYCNGTQVNLSAIPFTASNTYTFSPSQTFTINANTQVFVRVDSNNCSVTSDTVLFINNPLPPAFSISATPDTTVCEGTTVTINGPAGLFTYLWSGVTPNPGNVQNINLTAAGFYPVNLTIRDSVTKCLRTANQLLNVRIGVNPAVPTITVSQGSVPFCEGQSATLAPVPFSANNTYTFNGGGPVVNAPGTITVRVDSTNGCSSTSAPFEVTVNPLPAVPVVTVAPADTVCFGTEIVLTTADGLAGYAWSTGSNTATQTLTAVGTYNATVTVTDANNCSNTSAVSQVRIKAVPATPLIALAGSDNFCSNDSTKIYIVNPNSTTSFTWNTIGRLSGDTNIVKLSGQYAVVADSNGCSVNGNVITINVRPQPTPVISANGPFQFCEGGSVVLFVNYTNGVTWSTGATTPSIVVNTSGIVTVTVDSLNCVATSAPVDVVSFETPSVRAEKDTAIFGGENPLLRGIPGTTGTSPFGFEWFVRGTTDPISTSNEFSVRPESTTVYEVLLTDANGCTATDTVLVRASREIFVPNTFSPNADGNNDAFKVYGFGIAEIQVRIFSRTGVLVYETNRVDEIVETAIDGNSVKGWDGKYKGKELSGEALIWHITGKLRTGEELKVKGKNTGSVFILN